jgi:hypothetical protein
MKKSASFLFCLLLCTQVFAQDCSNCLFLQSNKVITETAYAQGGGIMYTVVITVPSSISRGYGTSTIKGFSKLLNLETFGPNGKSLGKKTFTFQCINNIFSYDIHSAPNQGNYFPTALQNTTGPSYMGYPAGLKAGDHFPDADLPYQQTMGGVPIDWVDKITGWQVVSKETVTTPAATWTALKITYTLTTVLKGGHPRNPPVYHITEWYVPGVGIVQYSGYGATIKITKIAG